MPGPSFSSTARRCGEAKVLEAWRLQFGASFLLGTTGRCAEARSVLHCHAVWMWRSRSFRALAAGRFEAWRIRQSGSKSKKGEEQGQEGRRKRRAKNQKDSYFLVGADSDVRHYRPLPAGPFHPFTAMLFECGEAAVWRSRSFRALAAGRFEAWRIRQSGSKSKKGEEQGQEGRRKRRAKNQKDSYFLVGADSDVRHYRPLPAGPFHPFTAMLFECGEAAVWRSRSVAKPLFWSLGSWTFRGLAAGCPAPGSKSKKARQKQEGRRKRQQEQKDSYFLVGAESDVRHYRPLPGGLHCHAVWVWRTALSCFCSWTFRGLAPVPSFTATLFESGEAVFFEPWQLGDFRGLAAGFGFVVQERPPTGPVGRVLLSWDVPPLFECSEAALFDPWHLAFRGLAAGCPAQGSKSKKARQKQEGRRKRQQEQKDS